MYSQSKKGLSLMELIVVIAIVGILATITFASFDTSKKQSRDRIRQSQLSEMRVALELYKSQNGRYPSTVVGCGSADATRFYGPGTMTAVGGVACNQYIDGLVPDYIPSLPRDPNQETVDGKGYMYRVSASGDTYKLIVYQTVESLSPKSLADEFARCPRDCGAGAPWCGAVPQTDTYAIYSAGAAECW